MHPKLKFKPRQFFIIACRRNFYDVLDSSLLVFVPNIGRRKMSVTLTLVREKAFKFLRSLFQRNLGTFCLIKFRREQNTLAFLASKASLFVIVHGPDVCQTFWILVRC